MSKYLTNQTIAGLGGELQIGDSSGHLLNIAGGVSSPDATNTNPDRLANVGALDERYSHKIQFVRLANDVTKTNDDTLSTPPGMTLTLQPGTYLFEGWGRVNVSGPGGSQIWVGRVTSGSTDQMQMLNIIAHSVNAPLSFAIQSGWLSNANFHVTGSTRQLVRGILTVIATATLELQFAQNTADTGSATLLQGSCMMATRLL